MYKPPFPRFALVVTGVAAIVGATLVFASRQFLESLGAPATPATLLLLRMLGSTIGGMSIMYLAMRNCPDRRLWSALLWCGVIEDGGMSLFFYFGLREGVVNTLAWGIEAALLSIAALHLALLIGLFCTQSANV